MEWRCALTDPPTPDDAPEFDYGAWRESAPVLAWDGNTQWVAYVQWHDPEDGYESPVWVQQGRDSYRLEGVTHWRPLPEVPRA